VLIIVHKCFIETPKNIERIKFEETAAEIAVEATAAVFPRACAKAIKFLI
jgi:hypothetical protein